MPTEDLTQTPQPNTAGTDDRHVVRVDDGELHRWVDETWDALMAANAATPKRPAVLVHGNDLVRHAGDGLAGFDVPSLREQTSRAVAYVEQKGSGVATKTPPTEVASALLSRERSEYGEDAPLVETMTTVPLLARDGTILSEPGYSAQHRTYYDPAEGLENLTIPGPGEVESMGEVEAARDFLLNDWLGEFGFSDEASRANALAVLLTVFVRDFIRTGVPLVPIQAHQQGWGKSTLTDAIFIPGCGAVPKLAGVRDEAEIEKRITTVLRSVPPAVVIDNYSGHLDSGSLANVLTTGMWHGRILGETRGIEIEPRCVWSVNGNNFTLSAELVERCPAPIVLGPGAYWEALCTRKGWDSTLRPREQARSKYRHPEYRTWAMAHRARAVEAAFVLIRHWLDGPAEDMASIGRPGEFYRPLLNHEDPEGQRVEPLRPDRDTGEFPEWQRVAGGILRAAGVGGMGENYAGWSTATDREGEEAAEFLATWRSLDLAPIPLKELFPRCRFSGPLADVLPTAVASGRADGTERRLEAWLRDHKELNFRGYRLMVDETPRGRPNRYFVLGGS